MQPMRSLAMPLEPPVHLLRMDSLPKLVAGGVPVLPINLVLARKRQFQFTPDTTLSSLVHAAQYYVETVGRFLMDDVPSAERRQLARILEAYRSKR